jgi:ligand-binding sensor domain-containing protein
MRLFAIPLLSVLLLSCQSTITSLPPLAQWVSINQGLPSHAPVLALAVTDAHKVYAAVYDRVGVYRSDGSLSDWTPDNLGLPPLPSFSLLLDRDTLWTGTASGLFERVANSQDWKREEAVPAVAVYALSREPGGTLFAGTDAHGVFSSADGGKTWAPLPGLADDIVLSVLGIDARTIFVGTSGHGVLVTHNGGTSWESIQVFENTYVPLLAADPRELRTLYASDRRAFMRSRDGGATWELVQGGIEKRDVYALLVDPDGKHIFAGTASHGIFVSMDDGASWQPGVPAQQSGEGAGLSVPEGHAVLSLANLGDAILAGTTDGVIRSVDQGQTWTPSDYHELRGIGSVLIHDLALSPTEGKLFVATEDGLYVRNGDTWKRSDVGPVDLPVLAVAISPTDPKLIYAGTSHAGVFVSDDGGETWRGTGGDLGGRGSVSGLVVDPRNQQIVFARVLYERIYKSADGGDNWRTVWTGMQPTSEIETVAIDPNDPGTMYAGGNDQFFHSNDAGERWVGGTLQGVTTFAILIDSRNSHKLLAGTTDGLYATEDGGAIWTRTGLPGITVTALSRDSNGSLYVGTKYDGAYFSGDDGKTLARFGAGLGGMGVIAMVVDEPRGIVYAATTGGLFCLVLGTGADRTAGGSSCH